MSGIGAQMLRNTHRDRNYLWHELMKRVFDLDVLVCPGCAGPMKVIAEINDPILARKLLEHLGLPADELELAPARGPPEDEPDEPDEPPPEPPPVTEDEWM
jgi:hypothetical protein